MRILRLYSRITITIFKEKPRQAFRTDTPSKKRFPVNITVASKEINNPSMIQS